MNENQGFHGPQPRFFSSDAHSELARIAYKWFKAMKATRIKALAGSMRVSRAALTMLRVGWVEKEQQYSFPEQNQRGEICSILRVREDGDQIPMVDRGVYILPRNNSGPLLLVEGAIDAAACWDAGFSVIGHPGVSEVGDLIVQILTKSNGTVIVVGDDFTSVSVRHSGRKRAETLAKMLSRALGKSIKVAMLPSSFMNVCDLRRKRRPTLLSMIANAYLVRSRSAKLN
jgi:hypothetical protein